jgi:hypothetical protein
MKKHNNKHITSLINTVCKHTELSSTDKLLFTKILGLAKSNGYCYATNRYLSELIGITPRSIRRSILNLCNHNFISSVIGSRQNSRKIYILNQDEMPENTTGQDVRGVDIKRQPYNIIETEKDNIIRKKNIKKKEENDIEIKTQELIVLKAFYENEKKASDPNTAYFQQLLKKYVKSSAGESFREIMEKTKQYLEYVVLCNETGFDLQPKNLKTYINQGGWNESDWLAKADRQRALSNTRKNNKGYTQNVKEGFVKDEMDRLHRLATYEDETI